MNKIYLISLFLLVTSLWSCEDAFETTLEIDPPEYTKQLSIQAYGSTRDSVLRVSVTSTTGVLEEKTKDQIKVTDAILLLYKNDVFVDTVPNGTWDGFDYTYFNINFEPGAVYKLVVEAPGFPTATAEAILAEASEVKSAIFNENGISNDIGEDNSEIEILIADDVSTENYYEVTPVIMDNIGSSNHIRIESVDPIVLQGFHYNILIFDDLSFNGMEKKLLLSTNKKKKSDVKDKLFINWKDISKAHFLFSKTARIQSDSEDNPFSTPIQIYSNIDNGVGIFSIANERLIKVEVE